MWKNPRGGGGGGGSPPPPQDFEDKLRGMRPREDDGKDTILGKTDQH